MENPRPEKVAVVDEVARAPRRRKRRHLDRVPGAHGQGPRRSAPQPAQQWRGVQDLQEHAGTPGSPGFGRRRPRRAADRSDRHNVRQGRCRGGRQGAPRVLPGQPAPGDQGRTARRQGHRSIRDQRPRRPAVAGEVLLAQLAGTMAAPLQQFASLLQALPRNLAYGLAALRDQRAEGAPVEPESTAGAESGDIAEPAAAESPADTSSDIDTEPSAQQP